MHDRNSFIEQAAALARDLPRARTLGLRAREAAVPLDWSKVVTDFEAVLRVTADAEALASQKLA